MSLWKLAGIVLRHRAAGDTAQPVSAAHEVSRTLEEMHETVSGFLALAALELRQASVSLVWMIALGLLTVVCIFAAWSALMAALAMWLISLDLPAAGVILAISLSNIALAAGAAYGAMHLARSLRFEATRRQLTTLPPEESVLREPEPAAIKRAELKVLSAKEQTLDHAALAGSAVKSRLTRPSTLALLAGGAASLGALWFLQSRGPKGRGGKSAAPLMLVLARKALPLALRSLGSRGTSHKV
jgi:hypothetical protein